MPGPAGPGPAGPAHAALAALAVMASAVDAFGDAALWSLSDEQAREAARDAFVLAQRVQAVALATVADLDSRPAAVPGARPGAGGQTFLAHTLHRNPGQAAADVRAAHTISPGADPATGGLPRLGQALAAGQVSREHVAVAVSVLRHLPKKLLRQPLTPQDLAAHGLTPTGDPLPASPAVDGKGDSAAGAGGDGGDQTGRRRLVCQGDLIDHLITEHSKRCDPGTIGQLTRYLLNAADPDGSNTFDPDAVTRRGLDLIQDATGMTIINGQLDQHTGALFRAAIDAFSRPTPARTPNRPATAR